MNRGKEIARVLIAYTIVCLLIGSIMGWIIARTLV